MNAITIKKLIEGSGLKGLRLVSDQMLENNQIFNINIIDNPDSYDWFTAGDFLLTTGYVFKGNVESQKKLIKELADLNCAGLGIKIKRYWDKIPDVILEEAKKRNFAIVEIPYNYSLSQITRVVNDEILKREDSMLKKYKNIHDTFLQASLAGGDLLEIVKIASEFVNNPVIMLDSDFNLLAFQDLASNLFPLNKFLKLITREKVFSKDFTDQIPRDVDNFTLSIKRKFITPKQEITCRVIPIVHSRTIYGYIIVWETMHKLEAIDYVALENAASMAALERIKTKQIEESKSREKEDFFDDLIEGRILSVNAVKNLAKVHGMNTNKNHLVIAVSDFRKNMSSISLVKLQNFTNKYFEAKFSKYNTTVKDENLLIFLEVLNGSNKSFLNDKIKANLNDYLNSLKHEVLDQKFRIGVSEICNDFLLIGKASHNALKSIKLAELIGSENEIIYAEELAIYNLINGSLSENNLINFFLTNLGPIFESDQKYQTDYLKTLEGFYEANGNITLAARNSYIHRNTFIYRIEKIKEILKTDLKNAEQNFNYQFALKVYKIIGDNLRSNLRK